MNLQHALRCITNSNAINKLNADLQLRESITSDKITWSKFDKLDITGGLDDDGNNLYIDNIQEFNGELEINSVDINYLYGKLKSLNVTNGRTSVINFEDGTTINDIVFNTSCLDRTGHSPSINNANISEEFIGEAYLGNKTLNLKGFLSKANHISRDARIGSLSFKSLGYLTVDSNGYNENWPQVTLDNHEFEINDHTYIIPNEFYKNLLFYVTQDAQDRKRYFAVLDYINGFVEDEDETNNIVIPTSDALKEYMPYGTELPVILGDYCFAGIGSNEKGGKNRHLYLTFDNTFIFNDSTTTTSDDGSVITVTTLSTAPFAENTFLTRSNAIQQVNINLPEKRPDDDLDTQNLYFSDFFTTCVKTTTTTTVDNGDGTSNTTENVETTFDFDEEAFNSCKGQLLEMVGGDADGLIFNSPYQEIDAYIEVD